MNTTSMTEGSVTRALFAMSGPIALSMLSTFTFQVVDVWFVGMLGAQALAALAFASTVYFLIVSLFMGMGVGVSALVARSTGEGDERGASCVATLGAGLGLAGSAALGALGLATVPWLFGLMGAPIELIGLIDAYMSVLYVGMPLLILGLVASSALHARGDMSVPALVFGAAGVVNAALDYALIFGAGPFPELGFEGAAIATVGSWVVIAVGLGARMRALGLWAWPGASSLPLTRAIVGASAPAIAAQILSPLTIMWLTSLIASSGAEAVGAYGVASRIETLAMVGISSVSVAIVPFLAQNMGAGLTARVERAIVFVGKSATYWGAASGALLVLGAPSLAAAFSDHDGVRRFTELYFYVVALSYVPFGLMTLTASLLHGLSEPRLSLRVLLVKTFAGTVPAALVGSLFGAPGVFAAIAVGNVVGALYAAHVLRAVVARLELSLPDPTADYLSDLRTLATWLHLHRRTS